MHGNGSGSVLEFIFLLVGLIRELALFAHGNKSGLESDCGCRGEDKSARIDANDRIDLARFESIDQQVDAAGKQTRISQ